MNVDQHPSQLKIFVCVFPISRFNNLVHFRQVHLIHPPSFRQIIPQAGGRDNPKKQGGITNDQESI